MILKRVALILFLNEIVQYAVQYELRCIYCSRNRRTLRAISICFSIHSKAQSSLYYPVRWISQTSRTSESSKSSRRGPVAIEGFVSSRLVGEEQKKKSEEAAARADDTTPATMGRQRQAALYCTS